MKSSFKNCLTVSNIQLANVVSDIHGKSAQNLHKSMLPKLNDISLTIDEFISPEQASKLQIIEQYYANLNVCKADL